MKRDGWHMIVLIPARNEEELLPRCLQSVITACARLPAEASYDIVVAVDSSTDRTALIAEEIVADKGIVFETGAGVVGRVRAMAANVGLSRYRGRLDSCWLANTDADCSVPETWLSDQLAVAIRGEEAIAGTINVDSFKEHPPGTAERFRAKYLIHPDLSHPHVHGANLGVRADAYLRAGGWGDLATAEDHDLWNRLLRAGSRRLSAAWVRVLTSGRKVGRAPEGFAAALAVSSEVA